MTSISLPLKRVRGRILRAGDYHEAEVVSRGTAQDFTGEQDRAKQSFAEDADINVLVRRFGVTGVVERFPAAPPTHVMFDDVFDFQSSMNAVVEAQRLFMKLDARLRRRFDNNPHEFVEFCSDPANSDELVKLGLAIAKPIVDNTPKPKSGVKEGKSDEPSDVSKGKGAGRKPAQGPDNSPSGE